jgi:hypothetical protein
LILSGIDPGKTYKNQVYLMQHNNEKGTAAAQDPRRLPPGIDPGGIWFCLLVAAFYRSRSAASYKMLLIVKRFISAGYTAVFKYYTVIV